MKVGDLVKNRQRHRYSVGVIVAVGYNKLWESDTVSTCPHPDIWVETAAGLRVWIHKNVEVISESR